MISLKKKSYVVVDMELGELSLESEGGGKARDTSNGTALHGLRAAIVPQERESTFDECSVEDADNGVAQSSTRPGALTIENLGQHDSSAKSPAQSISAKSNLENHSAEDEPPPWAHREIVLNKIDTEAPGEDWSPNNTEPLSVNASRSGTGLSTVADTLVETDGTVDGPSKITDKSTRTPSSLASFSAKGKDVHPDIEPITESYHDYEKEDKEPALPPARLLLIHSNDEIQGNNYQQQVCDDDVYDSGEEQRKIGEVLSSATRSITEDHHTLFHDQLRRQEYREPRISSIISQKHSQRLTHDGNNVYQSSSNVPHGLRIGNETSSADPERPLSSHSRATESPDRDLEAQTQSPHRPPFRCSAIYSYIFKHFINPLFPSTKRKARRVIALATIIGDILSAILIPRGHTIAEAAAAVIGITAVGTFITNQLADSPMHLRDLRRYVVPNQDYTTYED